MVVGPETHPGHGTGSSPPEFRDAVASMRAATLRPEIFCEEMPAPQRIAPYAAALSADVTVDGTDVGTGRIILLHDPAGNDAWDGTFRCVAYARAEIDLDLVTDPMLAEVGWTWLTEALAAHGATSSGSSGPAEAGASGVQEARISIWAVPPSSDMPPKLSVATRVTVPEGAAYAA